MSEKNKHKRSQVSWSWSEGILNASSLGRNAEMALRLSLLVSKLITDLEKRNHNPLTWTLNILCESQPKPEQHFSVEGKLSQCCNKPPLHCTDPSFDPALFQGEDEYRCSNCGRPFVTKRNDGINEN